MQDERAKYLAHPPVAAGRDQEYVIHYINNNQVVTEGVIKLLLKERWL